MSTMTLIDDYVDALLDGGPLDADGNHARGEHDAGEHGAGNHDRTEHGRIGHNGPDLTGTGTVPEPGPAPASGPALVPVIVPRVAPPLAAPPATAPDTARATHEAPAAAKAASHRWLRVTVGDDSYALELLRVQEVVRLAPIVALRGAAPAVLGVMNLRGRIVPVIDLGLWLRAGCVHGDERSRIVVVERDDDMIGMLVSAVEDVVTLGRERIEPPLASSDPGAIVGIARVGAAPTVLLDANALFG